MYFHFLLWLCVLYEPFIALRSVSFDTVNKRVAYKFLLLSEIEPVRVLTV